MNLIGEILPTSKVLLDWSVGNKNQLFERVAIEFEQQDGLNHQDVLDSLFAREKLGSTGLGYGVAVPHGRLMGLKQALGMFIRLQTPVDFESPDNQLVSLVFLMLVPENASETHLTVLSELASKFSLPHIRNTLLQTQDAFEVHQILTSEE